MIRLTNNIPEVNTANAEWVKLRCTYECYPNDALFWEQDSGSAYISLTDGNAVIYTNGTNTEELCEFINVISPCCIFSDLKTLKAIGKAPSEPCRVLAKVCDTQEKICSDTLRSDELYKLLDVDGLSLPQYEYFAVDICRRLNRSTASYFALKDKCAAITLNTGGYAIMNGIASHVKGFGTKALNAVSAINYGRMLLVCCRPQVEKFYTKNGFHFLYEAGYWVKNK